MLSVAGNTDQSPWEKSTFARGTAPDKLAVVGCGREGVSMSSEQPSEVGGARGWISTVTCIGPCGEIGDASSLLRAVDGEQTSISVSQEETYSEMGEKRFIVR